MAVAGKVSIDVKIQEKKHDLSCNVIVDLPKPLSKRDRRKLAKKMRKQNEKVSVDVSVDLPEPLPKKERKKLAKKKRKQNKALLKLSNMNAKPQELKSDTSGTSSMSPASLAQNWRINRGIEGKTVNTPVTGIKRISSIKGSNRKKNLDLPPQKKIESSSESDDESSNDDQASANNLNQNCPQVNKKHNTTVVMEEDNHSTTERVSAVHVARNRLPGIQEKVSIDIKIHEDKYDSSNPLMIVKKKKKLPKAQQENLQVVKPLTKKQKKKLQNIVAKKKKKLNRAELLEKLKKVQAKPEELDYLTSTASMQTHGIKRVSEENTVTIPNSCFKKMSNIKGSNRKKNLDLPPKKKIKLDPNVVSCEVSSSESDDDSNDDQASTDNLNQNCPQENIPQGNIPESSNSVEEINKSCGSSCADKREDYAKKVKKQDTTVMEVENHATTKRVPAVYVPVNRLPEIQAVREKLPIFCEEQTIMEAISENDVVIIHGNTGSGKTTQVPQFLYEAGYTQNDRLIAITEPRRIAAMTMAARVATEMNMPDIVAYHVRYENNVTAETQIKFMTDGVLVQTIKNDFYLERYSAIIIDEAHERSAYTDVLIGLLSRVITLREKKGMPPLKVIIMSATLRVEDFTQKGLFKVPPVLIQINSKLHEVITHHAKRTPTDYLEAAYQTVCQIHSQKSTGTVLVFLTGEKEVNTLCKMLRDTYPFKNKLIYEADKFENKSQVPDGADRFKKKKARKTESDPLSSFSAKINLDDYSAEPFDYESGQHQMSDDEDDCIKPINIESQEDFMPPLYTLPLYSVLPFAEQQKIFRPPPEGSRLCVVSTNVAETSITIPGLKYIVDSGKVKTKVYDNSGGMSKFCVSWTTKASAEQRKGRAGRTEKGHCFRLYSSAVFEDEFTYFPLPEIQRIPVDDVVLQLKTLGIRTVVNFPFPSPPEKEALKTAEQRLILLGALEDLNKEKRLTDILRWSYTAKVTTLGKAMSRFPVSPRYSKMLVLSHQGQISQYVIAIISAMTVPEVFVNVNLRHLTHEGIRKMDNYDTILKLGDAMVLLRTVSVFEESKHKVRFCEKNGISYKAMIEIQKMRIQLTREMNRIFKDLVQTPLPMELILEPPTVEQVGKLRRLLLIGFSDHVARKYTKEEMKVSKEFKNAYECLDSKEPVFIHPSSVLFSELPQYIVYQEIVQTTKRYMKGIVEIEPMWLPVYAATRCTFSEPLDEPAPSYNSNTDQILCTRTVTFGPSDWQLSPVRMEMPQSFKKYTWFACFLLDGKVLEFFAYYRKYLMAPPSFATRYWGRIRPMVKNLLQALITKEVDSKAALQKVWKEYPHYLLHEYWGWLPQSTHLEVELKWPGTNSS